MPPWVPIAIAVTLGVSLLVLLGVWLILRDRQRFRADTARLEGTNQSLSDTSGRLARLAHDFSETLAQMRWGKGPQP